MKRSSYKDEFSEIVTRLVNYFFFPPKDALKVISSSRRVFHYSDEIKFFHFSGLLSSVKDISDGHDCGNFTASGYSLRSKDLAMLKFLGEAIERFCLLVYREKDLIKDSYMNLKESAIDIGKIVSTSKRQRQQRHFKRFVYDDNTVLRWIEGTNLKTRQRVLLPAQFVYTNYKYANYERVIYLPISTGAAGGSNLESALFRGICEIIERDAFMIFYLNRLSPPIVDLGLIDEASEWLEIFSRYRLELNVLDITSDFGIPTFLAVVLDRSGFGAPISLGLKTHLDSSKAINGCIEEALHPRCWIRRIVEESGGTDKINKIDEKKIITLKERALFWYDKSRISDIGFLFQGKREKILKTKKYDKLDDKSMLEELLERLGDIDLYYKDVTMPDFSNLGYSVVKVTVPQAVPFYLDERYPYLGAERLYTVPKKLGLKDTVTSEESLYTLPHPFL